jgi:hypothetical protein
MRVFKESNYQLKKSEIRNDVTNIRGRGGRKDLQAVLQVRNRVDSSWMC